MADRVDVAPEGRLISSPLVVYGALPALALLLRLRVVALENFGFPPRWGGEMASVAVALSSGQGFSSPYWEPTGPTAVVPPVYPALLSLLFALFGVHSVSSGLAALYLNALFSALVCIPVLLVARSLFGEKVALLSALLWAVFPLLGHTEARFIWSTSLFTLLLTGLLALVLRIGGESSPWRWTGLGLLWGLAALVETQALALLPLLIPWLLLRRRARPAQLLVLLAATLAACAPWIARNSLVFEGPTFLRTNLGLELHRGLAEHDTELPGEPLSPLVLTPSRSRAELARYARLGEIEYMQRKLSAVARFASEHPREYGARTLGRIRTYWLGGARTRHFYGYAGRWDAVNWVLFALPAVIAAAGLAIALVGRVADVSLLLIVLAVLPAIHYFTLSLPRYRAPIEPLLVILCAYALLELRSARTRKGG